MADVAARRPRPKTAEDLHRLAELAHQRGLRLTQEHATVWFCSSTSSPEPHYVTGLSCDCRGFMEHQRCTHYALLLARLGWLPAAEGEPVTEVPALALIPSGNCTRGSGVYVKDCNRAGWPLPTCPVCTDTGEIQRQTQSASRGVRLAAAA
jgi:hypothetical protein